MIQNNKKMHLDYSKQWIRTTSQIINNDKMIIRCKEKNERKGMEYDYNSINWLFQLFKGNNFNGFESEYSPNNNDKCKNVEPPLVLAHLYSKLLQVEKRIKSLQWSAIDAWRLFGLIKETEKDIMNQFIGDVNNINDKTIVKLVGDVAYIECALERFSKNVNDLEDMETPLVLHDLRNRLNELQVTNKEKKLMLSEQQTSFKKNSKQLQLTCNPIQNKKTKTIAYQVGSKLNQNIYYNNKQLINNKNTFTSDISFRGELDCSMSDLSMMDECIQADLPASIIGSSCEIILASDILPDDDNNLNNFKSKENLKANNE